MPGNSRGTADTTRDIVAASSNAGNATSSRVGRVISVDAGASVGWVGDTEVQSAIYIWAQTHGRKERDSGSLASILNREGEFGHLPVQRKACRNPLIALNVLVLTPSPSGITSFLTTPVRWQPGHGPPRNRSRSANRLKSPRLGTKNILQVVLADDSNLASKPDALSTIGPVSPVDAKGESSETSRNNLNASIDPYQRGLHTWWRQFSIHGWLYSQHESPQNRRRPGSRS